MARSGCKTLTEHLDPADWTWEELSQLDPTQAVIIIPVGTTEAHGPYLPPATHVIISLAMARSGALAPRNASRLALMAPPASYTVAGFASGFSGTVSVHPETTVALVEDVARHFCATVSSPWPTPTWIRPTSATCTGPRSV